MIEQHDESLGYLVIRIRHLGELGLSLLQLLMLHQVPLC